MVTKVKDPSNLRLVGLIKEIDEFMEGEGRGFLFAPIVQPEGDHMSFVACKCATSTQFWATMMSVIGNIYDNIPEEKKKEFAEGFDAFVQATADFSFPNSKYAGGSNMKT